MRCSLFAVLSGLAALTVVGALPAAPSGVVVVINGLTVEAQR